MFHFFLSVLWFVMVSYGIYLLIRFLASLFINLLVIFGIILILIGIIIVGIIFFDSLKQLVSFLNPLGVIAVCILFVCAFLAGKKTCPECGGNKKIECNCTDGNGKMAAISNCPYCNGSGEIICKRCNGRGWIYLK